MAGGYYSSTWDRWAGTSTSATTSAWGEWCGSSQYYSFTTATTTVWYNWTDQTTSGNFCDQSWYTWQSEAPYQQQQQYQGQWPYQPYVESKEERQKREEAEKKRREEERIRMEEVAKQQKIAEEKALQLLLENLTENQAEIFKITGAIPVIAPSGKKYKIKRGVSHNVEELDEKGNRKCSLCFHPCEYGLPIPDVMLAQKLALEICEEDARRVANFS